MAEESAQELGAQWLIEQARTCYELAKARGKYDQRSGLEVRIGQVQQELLEWLVADAEASNGAWMFDDRGQERIYEEAGDALHALLSVMISRVINPAKALAMAIERNRIRAKEGK